MSWETLYHAPLLPVWAAGKPACVLVADACRGGAMRRPGGAWNRSRCMGKHALIRSEAAPPLQLEATVRIRRCAEAQ